jgi:superfamily I DNA and RNA helicase
MRQLTVKEALEQGYTKYIYADGGFQIVSDIEHIDNEDFDRGDILIIEKDPYHPEGISSKDIAEMFADHLEQQHSFESGDDTAQVYEAIKELDFTEAENKITEALSKLDYYRATDIRLVII